MNLTECEAAYERNDLLGAGAISHRVAEALVRLEKERDEARAENERLDAIVSSAADALRAVMYFWGRDPLAFGDEASVTSLAGQFAKLADRCREALDDVARETPS